MVRIQPVRHGALVLASLDQRLAVCGYLGRALSSDGAARPANVFDDEGLLEDFGQLVGQHAGHHVAGAAQGERRNDLDWFVG